MSEPSDKVALVTGASRGIGLATAQKLAETGVVVVTAQRGESPGFHSITADFTDSGVPASVVEHVDREFGRLDILVNNAGLMLESPAEEMSLQDWNRTLLVNLTAPFLLIQAAIPIMRKAGGGSIINIGSVEGLASNPEHSAYCASKAGLHGLTRAIAVDCGKDKIRCNAVAPGWIDTELNEEFIEHQVNPSEFRAKIGSIHPMQRTGKAEEVAETVVWLAEEKSAFVTGQIFVVDGGRTAKLSLP